jgi:AcrR family transcriptional regulator
VSRPLIYKHFANRTEMVVELYRRESAVLHAELRMVVRSANTLEDMYRALIRAAFKASSERGALFRALRAAGAWNRELQREHRVRDNQTVQFFADQACADFGVPEVEAKAATRMVLMAIESIIAQWLSKRTPANAAMLEETYLDLILGGFERIAARTSAGDRKEMTSGPPPG